MQSQIDSDRLSLRSNIITTDRPDSAQLVDLHVYVIPKNIWKDRQNLAENETMEQAISAGFVHVPENLNLHDLRQNILNICGQDSEFPREFIYLRSVGRCLTRVKYRQERDLRVKNYRPPTTIAPEIYVLEDHHEDDPLTTSNSKGYIYRESPLHHSSTSSPQLNTSRQPSWIKPIGAPPPPPLTKYPSFTPSGERQNSTNLNGPAVASFSNLSTSSSTLSARDVAKLREEQERLRLRQIELARQRREMEQEQQKRTKELLEKQQKLSKERKKKEEAAAIRIQRAYRAYRKRRKTVEGQRRQRENAANEIERLQKEARSLARRKAEEEHKEKIQAHDVVKLSDRFKELKQKRIELDATREAIVRQMQQLHAQISVRRKEERDAWKQKYLIERKKTAALEERTRSISKDAPEISSQLEAAKARLNNSNKLRQQAENECRILKEELQKLRLNMNTIEKQSLPQQPPPPSQQEKPTIPPVSLDITLQY